MENNADVLTKVEAQAWLNNGMLPDNFCERLENFVEFYNCPNCDGVQDMNVVLRDWWNDEAPSWCPFCCDGAMLAAGSEHTPEAGEQGK